MYMYDEFNKIVYSIRDMNSSVENVILLVMGVVFIVLGVVARVKKFPSRFSHNKRQKHINGNNTETNGSLNKSDLIDNNLSSIALRYFDFVLVFFGAESIVMGVVHILNIKGVGSQIWIFTTAVLICILLAVINFSSSYMGNKERIKTINATVSKCEDKTKSKIFDNTYNVTLEFRESGNTKRYTFCKSFSKRRLPQIGSRYSLLYSYDLKKYITKEEISSKRIKGIICLLIALLMILALLSCIVEYIPRKSILKNGESMV